MYLQCVCLCGLFFFVMIEEDKFDHPFTKQLIFTTNRQQLCLSKKQIVILVHLDKLHYPH